jgi:hypothetical protein
MHAFQKPIASVAILVSKVTAPANHVKAVSPISRVSLKIRKSVSESCRFRVRGEIQ